LGEPPQSSVRS